MTSAPATLFDDESMSYSKIPSPCALEVDFPASMLSQVGLKESWRKEIHRPATSTHKWWAKRLGTVFRGILLSAACSPGDAEAAYGQSARLKGLTVFDPFAGSGTTAVEALKLGARVVSLDINPVATLVQRQAVQSWDMAKLLSLYRAVEGSVREEIDRVHRSEDGRPVLYYFWVADAACPTCGELVHLFDSPVYSRNAYPQRVPRAQIVCPTCLSLAEDRYDFDQLTCAQGHTLTQSGPVRRSSMTCTNGHVHRVIDALGDALPSYTMYAKMVVDARGNKTYESISDWDRALYLECSESLDPAPPGMVVPTGLLSSGNNTDQALRWNFRAWSDFFNARQLYSLSLLATAIRDLEGSSPEREALCALFSGTLEFNNRFTSFKGEGTGAVRHMFSHHILKPERTPLEAHPWGTPQSSGAFSTLFNSRLVRANQYKTTPTDLVRADNQVVRVSGLSCPLEASIAQSWKDMRCDPSAVFMATRDGGKSGLPDESVDLVVTDPPYMDNVHYAELADFFHAWLGQMRPFAGYPSEATTRNSREVQDADPVEFGRAIERVWRECSRVLKPNGLIAFTFHQARAAGWVELVKALNRANLTITAIQPVKGEMSTSVVKAGAREPSNLDSVVVCRKRALVGASAYATVEDAFDAAVALLRGLLTEGVEVGAGDVRSVVRGTLLAHLSVEGGDLTSKVPAVDRYADAAIATLLRQ